MTFDPNTATLDELRNWLAEDDGWQLHEDGLWYIPGEFPAKDHPYPPTLDGAAKALPEGWKWSRDYGECWRAWVGLEPYVEVPDTKSEIADRYRLAVMTRLAGRSNQ